MKTLQKIFGILNKSEKKRFIIVCFFLMILTLFEVIGMSSDQNNVSNDDLLGDNCNDLVFN